MHRTRRHHHRAYLTTEEAERAGIRAPVGEFTVAVGASGQAQSMIASLAGHFIPAGESFSMEEVAGTVSGDVSADAVATALFNAAFEAGAQDLVRSGRGALPCSHYFCGQCQSHHAKSTFQPDPN